MKLFPALLALGVFLAFLSAPLAADDLDELAKEFWTWRATTQPLSGDDINRIVRPPGWAPDWSPEAVERQRQALQAFEARWKDMEPSDWPVARQVDYQLMGSALARVRWELEVLRVWERNPLFYVGQSLGAIFEELLAPPPFDSTRQENLVARMDSIPATMEAAKANLTDARRPFARLTIAFLQDVRPRLETVMRELEPFLTAETAARLQSTTANAIKALESYRGWLEERVDSLSPETAIGRDAYVFFLEEVALLPFTPEELVAMGRQEWERAVAFEAYEKQRNQGLPELALAVDQDEWVEREEKAELAIRAFLEEKGILTIPDWVQHYRNLPMPAYLEPLAALGVTAHHGAPDELNQDGISYIPEPSPTLSYFYLATARDPRPLVIHEGIPGHYFHLVRSWEQENIIRRHYYDSGPTEGLGFYAEEMMLQAGLFDDSPRTREIIYNFMRLRALRVEVDVKLATGEFTIDEAGDYLERTVPMDAETAHGEAAFFASTPGQAISYQIGKLQILRFLAEARRTEGEDFSLRAFHDFVWKNANVPIALQEWEYFQLRE